MSATPAPRLAARSATLMAMSCALLLTAYAPVTAQRRGTILRRGAPGAPAQPLTKVLVSLAGTRYTAEVDADCHVNENAPVGGPRAYYVMMYPWFGQRVSPDRPQWRLNLEIRRGAAPGVYDQFVFSFLDRTRSAVIQTVSGAERMGSGSVRVTRHGRGARFDVDGRSKAGEPVHATVDCSEFQASEGGG